MQVVNLAGMMQPPMGGYGGYGSVWPQQYMFPGAGMGMMQPPFQQPSQWGGAGPTFGPSISARATEVHQQQADHYRGLEGAVSDRIERQASKSKAIAARGSLSAEEAKSVGKAGKAKGVKPQGFRVF